MRTTLRDLWGWLFVPVLAIALVSGCIVGGVALVMHKDAEAARAVRAEQVAIRQAEEAADQKAAAEKAAAEEAAAEKAAAEKAAAEKAAAEKAARDRAAAAAAAARNVIQGDFTVPDINGALVTHVGGYPGQPLNTLGMRQLNKLEAMIDSLMSGKTYPCPQGAGGGYGDIVVGGQVVVRDGSGSVLATSALTGGQVNVNGCTFTYSVDVPDADFYQITVTHRGALSYSRADLVARDWRVSGTL